MALRTATLAALAALVGISSLASAAAVNATPTANATVQPAGPRTGANGVNFLNIEGANFNNFASYGVLDFTAPASGFGGNVTGINSLTFSLTQSNAGFSAAGPVNVYLAADRTTSISNAGGSPLIFDPALGGGEGIADGGQLGDLEFIGAINYAVVSNGTVDSLIVSSFSAIAEQRLIDAINDNGLVRLVVTPGETSTAATYGGIGHNNEAFRPALAIDAVVPEPTAFAAVGLAGLLAAKRRRK